MDSDSMQRAAYRVRLLAINALFEQARLGTTSAATVGAIEDLAVMAEKMEEGFMPPEHDDLDELQAHLLYHALLS